MAQVRVEGENRVPKRLKSPSKLVSGREVQHFWAKSRPPMIAAPFKWVIERRVPKEGLHKSPYDMLGIDVKH